jgi:hypothetical protein
MGASTYIAHANQLTYAGYCALGGANNPNLVSHSVYLNGRYMHTEYYLVR